MTNELFDIECVDDVVVVRLSGMQLDSRSAVDELHDELQSLIEEQRPRKLVVSFGRVSHATSQAFGRLVHIQKQIEESGGMIKLCEIHPAIRNAFNVLDLDGRFSPIHDCESEALNDF